MSELRLAVAATAFAIVLGIPAQSRAQSGDKKFFRVTFTNQTDVTVLFTWQWPDQEAEKVTLEPGKKIVAEYKQAPGLKKPTLAVTFKPAPRVKDESSDLNSGHVDPVTNNPGVIYDFQKAETNLGKIIILKPR